MREEEEFFHREIKERDEDGCEQFGIEITIRSKQILREEIHQPLREQHADEADDSEDKELRALAVGEFAVGEDPLDTQQIGDDESDRIAAESADEVMGMADTRNEPQETEIRHESDASGEPVADKLQKEIARRGLKMGYDGLRFHNGCKDSAFF